MYVCICNALKEKTVREVAQRGTGASSASDLFRCLGATPQCGKCVSHALNIFQDECRRAPVGAG